jgi:hypothetical protein
MGADRFWEQQNLAPLELSNLRRSLESLAEAWETRARLYQPGVERETFNRCARDLRETLKRST